MPVVSAKEADIRSFSSEFVSDGDYVLDVGCADGSTLQLIDAGCEGSVWYCGIDYPYWKNKDIGLSESKSAQYVRGDGHELPFASDSFDVVIMTHVLEHMFTVREPLSELRRVLKPDGKGLIIVPLLGSSLSGILYRNRNPINTVRAVLSDFGIVQQKSPGNGHNQFHGYERWRQLIAAELDIVDSYGWGGPELFARIVGGGYAHALSVVFEKFGIDLSIDYFDTDTHDDDWRNSRPFLIGTYVAKPQG